MNPREKSVFEKQITFLIYQSLERPHGYESIRHTRVKIVCREKRGREWGGGGRRRRGGGGGGGKWPQAGWVKGCDGCKCEHFVVRAIVVAVVSFCSCCCSRQCRCH